jgi:chromosome segregation ATPase
LRAFVAGLDKDAAAIAAPDDNIEKLESDVAACKGLVASAVGRHEESRRALSQAEGKVATAVAEFGSATREQQAAADHLRDVLTDGDRTSLDEAVSEAQRDRASKLNALETAREGVRSYDVDTIKRRIENLERAANRAGEERLELTRNIASLEATVTREGTTGPASLVAEASEEEFAAISARDRLRHEADVLVD